MSSALADLLRAGLWLALATALGWQFDGAFGALLAVLIAAAYLVMRHLWRLTQLIRWAQQPLGTETPSASGIWDEAYATLRRRARLGAEQREELGVLLDRFRQAAEVMPDGVVILDGHRNIEWMNARAELSLNLNSSRDLGSPITYLLREPEFLDYLGQSYPSGSLILRSARSPGQMLQIQSAPFAAGRSLLLVRDVTQIQKLETMRRDFVANVSHELRTPLTVVAGFLETAADGLADLPPEDIHQFLDMAGDQAKRMQRLIEDLLTLATLETDAPPQEEAIDMAALLAEVRDDTVALSGGRHAIELENSGPPTLLGSYKEVRSALGNLASNAVRYTPTNGRIALSWRSNAVGAVYTVADTGIGIDAQHLPRLTERFYRVDRGRSRETGGTGLGLAIVKHVLERHQARLEINSEPGRGSTFAVTFPGRRIQNALPEETGSQAAS
ncbi:MAG: phosphate regulon sensor histidine kinase PhoR [Rhodocyclaceae bacterium]|nr:phosphate regulon sensor histidine kinase PhoR [Rhodocyclaceae bacterium]